MAVSSAAVFNICPIITNHPFVRASSCALKLDEGCGGLSGATIVAQSLEEKKHRTASSSKSDCCVLKRVFKLYSYFLGVTNF